ncbi:hypothetical protein SS50377_28708 [Spironucleus salmonicida]|uniref:SANT domain-containing protein n=1 Tax=Spironucleus salmonicida TaxID=348837 RepID=V6LVN5_9EUKA|nr:hypothetical protein SS50377_28708 [Spironucleus salmonicida]|eukprot:EST44879.1 Hypothetical protein SS50377_15219 [Spironucleus salmonicida]
MQSGIEELIRLLANSSDIDLSLLQHGQKDPDTIQISIQKLQSSKTWTQKQKRTLINAVQQFGYNLERIQTTYFPSMTLSQLKNQYFYMKKKKNQLD